MYGISEKVVLGVKDGKDSNMKIFQLITPESIIYQIKNIKTNPVVLAMIYY